MGWICAAARVQLLGTDDDRLWGPRAGERFCQYLREPGGADGAGLPRARDRPPGRHPSRSAGLRPGYEDQVVARLSSGVRAGLGPLGGRLVGPWLNASANVK